MNETTTKRQRRQFSAKDRGRWIELYQRSGKSVRDFCRDNAVCQSSLSRWLRQMRAGTEGEGHEGSLVEVRVDLPEDQKTGLVWIRDEISYEQDYQPSQFYRRAFVRPVYVHPKKLHGPRIAPMPVRVIPQ